MTHQRTNLELRFDGPIPKHLTENNDRAQRGAKSAVRDMIENYKAQEIQYAEEADKIQIKVCDGTATPQEEKRLDWVREKLRRLRDNIESMDPDVEKHEQLLAAE